MLTSEQDSGRLRDGAFLVHRVAADDRLGLPAGTNAATWEVVSEMNRGTATNGGPWKVFTLAPSNRPSLRIQFAVEDLATP